MIMVKSHEFTPTKGTSKRCKSRDSTRVQKSFSIGIGGIVKILSPLQTPTPLLLINDQLITMHY